MDRGTTRRVERFEDLVAWQKGRLITSSIYRVTSEGHAAKDFRFVDQVRAAAVSTMSNVAEGFERAGQAEYIRFLNMAKASCAEVRSLLYVALDAGYLDDEQFGLLRAQAEEVSRLIAGLMRSIARVDRDAAPRRGSRQ